ncbi:hypothetical protein EKO04_010458 [Ascochyta lentis]|uniref:Uncharacterized protein n=1 Tax=Ascochyta lentis TaxID=205686 RepID=A0A8H7ITF1_9PLEO|nr:hypothetical protein EKO04_010458 [Ascochyta lentis]
MRSTLSILTTARALSAYTLINHKPFMTDPVNGTSDYKISLDTIVNGETANRAVAPAESSMAKRRIGSKFKRDAAKRSFKVALKALDPFEE